MADANDVRAAALFVTEAGMRAGTLGRRLPDLRAGLASRPDDSGVHFAWASKFIDQLTRPTPPVGATASFVRDWFVAVESFRWRWVTWPIGPESVTDAALRLFPADPYLLTLKGTWLAMQAGPEQSDFGGFMHFIPSYGSPEAVDALASGQPVPGLTSTSHGNFSRKALQEAVSTFRKALALDATLTEARVRLGRILYLSDRTGEAATELERAHRDALSAKEPILAYWASLQLGLVHEQQNAHDRAAAAYREAVRIHPAGRSARLALGSLAAREGVLDEAWTRAAEAMGADPAAGRGDLDPWTLFPFYQYWRLPELLDSMRAIVQGAGRQ
jgi:tetratricopeptide (TPR) repeat protein